MHQPEHADVATYRATADAFRARDLDAINELIHEQVVWHIPGDSWLSGEVRGRSEALAFLERLVAKTNGSFILEDVHVLGNEDHVLTVQRIGGTFEGQTKVFDMVTVIRFEDGKQRERWFHFLDQEEMDRFMSVFD